MKIIPANILQAGELSELAKAIYREYYLHLWNKGGADWYMNEHAYHADKIKEELADKNNLHFIVYENNQPLGYLKIKLDAELKESDTQNCLEIERIYLHRSASGKGTGKQLMLLTEKIAREYHKEIIFLKAMDTSEDAITFYQKMGYIICGGLTLPFPQMKEQYRGMVILQKKISTSGDHA
jgi:GNAT superfamily N-acetyltransferase